jgi:hypothetical protein
MPVRGSGLGLTAHEEGAPHGDGPPPSTCGYTAEGVRVGDCLLTGVKSQGLVSWPIKTGSLLRGFDALLRRFLHPALVFGEGRHHRRGCGRRCREEQPVEVRQGRPCRRPYRVDDHDREQVLRFVESVLDEKGRRHGRQAYGYVMFAGVALYCPDGVPIYVQEAAASICSGLLCDALTRAGFIWERPLFAMMPANLAEHFDVRGEPGA